MSYLSKSRRIQLVTIIKSRLAAGEISKRFAFEICWLESLDDFAAQLRDEILNASAPVATPALPPLTIVATPKPKKAKSKQVAILHDFRALGVLMTAKAA